MSLPLSCAVLILAGAAGPNQPAAYPRAELLIEAAELAKPEVAKQFRILDARGKGQYSEGHIPGAVWIDQLTWAKAFAASQDPEAWSKRIGARGS
jgi:3-mercaptopyruvate sulfurtransferase SseA